MPITSDRQDGGAGHRGSPAGAAWGGLGQAANPVKHMDATMDGMSERKSAESWLVDMDGVLAHEGQPIPGAEEFIRRLARSGKRFLVLTNNSIFT
ncbi:MAG TPA: hypothetical protein VII16_10085, partial [Actinomycetes bacterium]